MHGIAASSKIAVSPPPPEDEQQHMDDSAWLDNFGHGEALGTALATSPALKSLMGSSWQAIAFSTACYDCRLEPRLHHLAFPGE